MFVLNKNGHYFKIKTDEVNVIKDLLHECRIYDDENALLEVVCSECGLEFDEVKGSTFLITMKDDQLLLIDDRGIASCFDGPVETFVATFCI